MLDSGVLTLSGKEGAILGKVIGVHGYHLGRNSEHFTKTFRGSCHGFLFYGLAMLMRTRARYGMVWIR